MARGGPAIGAELEKYYARVRANGREAKADWERDEAFVAIATARWSDDLEGSSAGRESNRARMRLRHEGFVALSRAKQEVQALKAAADAALAAWGRGR